MVGRPPASSEPEARGARAAVAPEAGPGQRSDAVLALPSFCMINHNGSRYLDRSLSAVEPLRQSFSEVLLVDDASTDDSVRFVEARFPWVRVIRMPENRGPAAARNVALRAAESDRVLMVDNDVRIPANCLERLQEALSENPRAAVAVPRCVYADRPDLIQFDGARSHFIGQQTVESTDLPLKEGATKPRRIGSLISACFLLDRGRVGRDIEFDDSFFIYLEDHDFGLRVRGRGYDLISVPDVVCLHDEGTVDLSIRQVGSYSKRRVFYLIRNRWLLLSKDYGLWTLIALAPVLAVYEIAQLVIVLKKGWLPQWLAAVRWMMSHTRDTLRKRRAVLRTRVLPDRKLLSGGRIPFRSELVAGRLERWGQAVLNGVASGYWSVVRHCI